MAPGRRRQNAPPPGVRYAELDEKVATFQAFHILRTTKRGNNKHGKTIFFPFFFSLPPMVIYGIKVCRISELCTALVYLSTSQMGEWRGGDEQNTDH